MKLKKMNLNMLLLTGMLISPLVTMSQLKKKTYLACRMDGFKGSTVFMDCPTSALSKQFPAVEGALYEQRFETAENLPFMINGKLEVFLQPGDSLVIDLRYGERRYEDVEFNGTDRAVLQNELIQDLIMANRALKYKDNLLACIVVETQPVDRHNHSKRLLSRAYDLIEKNKTSLSPEFCEYFLAGAEAFYMGSMIKYPLMYKEVKQMPIDKMGIGDFWELDKDLKVRESNVALVNPSYSSFLIDYMDYTKTRDAHRKGTGYVAPRELNAMFDAISSTYSGPVRDAVLYTFLSGYVRNGKNLEKIEPMIKRYEMEFNKNKAFMQELNKMMQ